MILTVVLLLFSFVRWIKGEENIKKLVQGHTGSKLYSQYSNLNNLALRVRQSIIGIKFFSCSWICQLSSAKYSCFKFFSPWSIYNCATNMFFSKSVSFSWLLVSQSYYPVSLLLFSFEKSRKLNLLIIFNESINKM